MSDDEGGVLTPKEAVEAAVASWKSAYKTSIHETESKDAGAATFVVICSKPTQTRPVPDCVANVHVRVDNVGEGGSSVLTYQGAFGRLACGTCLNSRVPMHVLAL